MSNYLILRILFIWIILNILGNTIKYSFKIESKYIVWILLIFSIFVNFLFFGIGFKNFLIGFVSFSFSVSSYDLFKYFCLIVGRKK